jgi:hypothetical protein
MYAGAGAKPLNTLPPFKSSLAFLAFGHPITIPHASSFTANK